jgi:VanZ family protein
MAALPRRVLFCAPFIALTHSGRRRSGIVDPESALPTLPPRRRFFVQFMQYWLPVLVYVTLILALSSQPHLKPPLSFKNSDKLFHALEYLGLGLLLARALRASLRMREPGFAAVIALAACVLMGASDEYYQSFVPGRESSVYDVLADSVGGAMAQLLYVWLTRG